MKLLIFTLYDTVTEEHGNLMLAKTKGHMARILKDNLKKPEDVQEYVLYCLGTFNTDSGEIVAYNAPEVVNLGILLDIEELSEKAKKQQEKLDILESKKGENHG